MYNCKRGWIKVGLALLIVLITSSAVLSGCGNQREKVVIYTSAEDYRVDYYRQRLEEKFPDYDIVLEYMATGNLAAKLKAEGKSSECDIVHSIEYGYLDQLENSGVLADLSDYDQSMFMDDMATSGYYLPELRNGGAIIINEDVLAEKNLAAPVSYADLLKPEYKGLISMPSPKSSGTGYMFLKNLVNTMGETEAFAYFDKLSTNILQYTSSGSGPVNALIQKEAAIGLGMTAQAVTAINQGANLKIVFFEEGAPYSCYGYGIIAGKENRDCVNEVLKFIYTDLIEENCEKFFPEKIYKEKDFKVEHYPENISYADMSNNTQEEKERLLGKWQY